MIMGATLRPEGQVQHADIQLAEPIMRALATAFALSLALAVSQPLSAQMDIGFRAGASIADVSLDTEGVGPDLSTTTGFVGGVFLDIPLTSNLYFQPGLGFAQKGAEVSDDFEGEEVTFGVNLDYIEVPLLLKYAFPTSGSLGVHVYGGPALSFETTCEFSFESDEFGADVACDAEGSDLELTTKSFDLGAMFGGGIAFPVGRASILVDAFYNLGLTNIDDNAEGDDSLKNRAIYITGGVSIPLGR